VPQGAFIGRGKMNVMDATTLADYVLKQYPDVETLQQFGYQFFFYRSERMHAFATIAASAEDYDHQVSKLDRPGIYRLNMGIGKDSFQAMFGKEKVDTSKWDYTAANVIMPHPDYSAQRFVCVLSPTGDTLDKVHALLGEAYALAKSRFLKQHSALGRADDD
jgi:hypothetical protein